MAEDPITCAKKCAASKKLMELYYQRKDGLRKRYEVEPYEIRDGFLWAYDSKSGGRHAKRFAIGGILLPAMMETDWEVPEDHARKLWPRKLAGETKEDMEEEDAQDADQNRLED